MSMCIYNVCMSVYEYFVLLECTSGTWCVYINIMYMCMCVCHDLIPCYSKKRVG